MVWQRDEPKLRKGGKKLKQKKKIGGKYSLADWLFKKKKKKKKDEEEEEEEEEVNEWVNFSFFIEYTNNCLFQVVATGYCSSSVGHMTIRTNQKQASILHAERKAENTHEYNLLTPAFEMRGCHFCRHMLDSSYWMDYKLFVPFIIKIQIIENKWCLVSM